MKGLRTICLCKLIFTVSFPAFAQLELPDALQGNPLEDKTVGETPDNPFLPIHSFGMEGVIQDEITGVSATNATHLPSVDGYVGQAIYFDGTSSAEVPIDLYPTSMPDMTIAMMVRADPLPEDPDELISVPTSGYIFSDGDSFIILNNQKKSSAFLSAFSAGAQVHDSSMFQVPHGAWHMIAMTRKIEKRTNADGVKTFHAVLGFYVNGRFKQGIAEIAETEEEVQKELGSEPPLFTLASFRQRSTKLRGAIDHMIIYDWSMDKEELDEVRGRFRQAAGNEWLNSQGVTAQPIEASQAPPNSIDGGIAGSGADEVSEELTLGYDEAPPELLSRGESTDGAGLAGQDADTTREAISEFSQNPHEQLMREAEETRRREAATDTAIESSGLVGAGSPTVAPSVATADETQELIASQEGREMLQSADWRIEGMVPNSQDKSTLYPGDEVTLKVRISKDDPANKIPSVRLVTNVGPGTPSPSYDLTINTAQAKPTDERDVPITLPVPETLAFEEGATQLVWRPKVWLNAPDGLPLRDAIAGNHNRDLAITVLRSAPSTDCPTASQDLDGSRTASACLSSTGVPRGLPDSDTSADSTPVEQIGDGLVATAPSGRAEWNNETVLSERVGVLNIYLYEKNDKPCDLRFNGRKLGPCAGQGEGKLSSPRAPRASGESLVTTGLQVCHRKANGRVKGLRLWERPRTESGAVGIEEYFDPIFERTNCNDWQRRVDCPEGTYGVGIRPHWRDGSGLAPMGYLVGLQLICAPSEPQS